jgi:hypothetical protein
MTRCPFSNSWRKLLLERVPARAGQSDRVTDGDASVFAGILDDLHFAVALRQTTNLLNQQTLHRANMPSKSLPLPDTISDLANCS